MKKTMITILTGSILLLCVGISYSYFTGMIFGEGKKLKVAATELRILFTDSSSLSDNEIEPGWSQTKTFSVKNESDDNFNYNIVFEKLVNTFVTSGFLQYKITSSNGYNMEGYLDIPKSSTPQDVVLAYDIDIPKDATHGYTIEFVYHNSNTVDQSEDMGKELKGNLAIVEGTVNPNVKYTVTMNSEHGTITPTSNQAIKKGNLEFEVTPDTGYDINSMSASCDPVANTVIVGNKIKVNDIRQNHNCEVSFDKELYTVNIVVNNGKSDALNKVVEYGGSGTATITPNYGYTLSGATAEGTGCSIESGILTISNVQSSGTCTVTLPRDKYNVTLTGTGIQESNSPQEAEYEGSTTITFTLSDGYELGSNVINCDNGEPNIEGNTLTVSNVTADTTCTLSPVLKSYDVTLKVVGGTPECETKQITHNESGTYTIQNSTGYKLELNESISCTGNATGSLSGSTVTISGVTTVQECTVNLKKETYSVSVSVNSSTMGSVSPSNTTVNYGANLEVTISPSSGYKYSSNTCGIIPNNNKMIFNNIIENINCSVTFEEDTTLAAIIKKVYPSQGERSSNSFESVFPLDSKGNLISTPGMYETKDYDGNVTYYLTGNPNNWVSFAGKLWRIIRINGNGSVRMLYAGTGERGHGFINSGDITNSDDVGMKNSLIKYNNNLKHPAYVGWKYTYGNSLESNRRNGTSSNIYKTMENWYNTNIVKDDKTDENPINSNILKNYIDNEAIYCNDRELANDSVFSTNKDFSYIEYEKLSINKGVPFLTCNENDRFFKFGLMTANEIVLAGGNTIKSNDKVYYSLAGPYVTEKGCESDIDCSITASLQWWTMSPALFHYSTANVAYPIYASVFFVAGTGGGSTDYTGRLGIAPVTNVMSLTTIDGGGAVRPVISLKKNVFVVEGNGTYEKPYKVSV